MCYLSAHLPLAVKCLSVCDKRFFECNRTILKHYFYGMEEQQRQFVLSLLAYSVQREIPAKKLCQLCSIDLEGLTKGHIEISKKQFNDLWKNASHLCNDPLFGLHFGESLQLAALGIVGEIIKSSDTVGQAISIAASLTGTVTDLFKMKIERSKKSFVIHLISTDSQNNEFVERQLADLLIVFTIHELNAFILEKIKPSSVMYPYKISNKKEYERVLRCKTIKKGNGYSIEFKNSYWDEPILTADYELQKLFVQKLNSQQKDMLTSVKAFKVKIVDYLMQNSYLGILSLEDVAGNFNMTSRSLQRKLQEEDTTFQQLADSVRKSLAVHYLASGNYQIKEISNMLGYNELSAFSRAFKRWTGKAPMNY
jgi:AraC-like DNA-binding protein